MFMVSEIRNERPESYIIDIYPFTEGLIIE